MRIFKKISKKFTQRNNDDYRYSQISEEDLDSRILHYGRHCKELKENPILKDIFNQLEVEMTDLLKRVTDEKERANINCTFYTLGTLQNRINIYISEMEDRIAQSENEE